MELFAEIKPLSFWGRNKIDIILEKSLHTVSDFLEEIVNKENATIDDKTKALKVHYKFKLGFVFFGHIKRVSTKFTCSRIDNYSIQ
jgi:hypothetical protein